MGDGEGGEGSVACAQVYMAANRSILLLMPTMGRIITSLIFAILNKIYHLSLMLEPKFPLPGPRDASNHFHDSFRIEYTLSNTEKKYGTKKKLPVTGTGTTQITVVKLNIPGHGAIPVQTQWQHGVPYHEELNVNSTYIMPSSTTGRETPDSVQSGAVRSVVPGHRKRLTSQSHVPNQYR